MNDKAASLMIYEHRALYIT